MTEVLEEILVTWCFNKVVQYYVLCFILSNGSDNQGQWSLVQYNLLVQFIIVTHSHVQSITLSCPLLEQNMLSFKK